MVLFVDTFTEYFTPEVGVAAVPPSAFYLDPTRAPLLARFTFDKPASGYALLMTAMGIEVEIVRPARSRFHRTRRRPAACTARGGSTTPGCRPRWPPVAYP